MGISREVVRATRTCAICERTLLVGERAVRYSPDGENFVDVCPLCQEIALDHGWLKEGSPMSPVMAEPRRKRLGGLGTLFESRKPNVEPVVDEPILRRLSEPELAMVEAADLFNESAFRRTIEDFGEPRLLAMPEIVLTLAWDMSWYQYRITPDSGQPVRLAERGHDPHDLETLFTGWNARLTQ